MGQTFGSSASSTTPTTTERTTYIVGSPACTTTSSRAADVEDIISTAATPSDPDNNPSSPSSSGAPSIDATSVNINNNKKVMVEPYVITMTINCVKGCEHNCRYCFAKHEARCPPDWPTMRVVQSEVDAPRPKVPLGSVMFPSLHDITPTVVDPCLKIILALLQSQSRVVVFSKPHLSVIQKICSAASNYKELLRFKFTISAMDDTILSYWEPGAPPFAERLESLKCAYNAGFKTAVSVGPMLDYLHVVELVNTVEPFVTDVIIICRLQLIPEMVSEAKSPQDKAMLNAVLDNQTDEKIIQLHDILKTRPKVRWHTQLQGLLGEFRPGIHWED
ncbi:DUF1848 family protein [Pelomyxa schiedti]|nr:DUF1848 family protein [Pelomyxa schiedti]